MVESASLASEDGHCSFRLLAECLMSDVCSWRHHRLPQTLASAHVNQMVPFESQRQILPNNHQHIGVSAELHSRHMGDRRAAAGKERKLHNRMQR